MSNSLALLRLRLARRPASARPAHPTGGLVPSLPTSLIFVRDRHGVDLFAPWGQIHDL
jgi:hypothetical protein